MGRVCQKQPTKYTAKIEHWVQDPSSFQNETPHSKAVRLVPCAGCSLNTTTLIPSSNRCQSTCLFTISLHRTIRLLPSRTPRPLTFVDFKVSRSDCETRVRKFTNRLDILPDFSEINLSNTGDLTPATIRNTDLFENDSDKLLIASLSAIFASYDFLNFYSDRSMANAGTPDLNMGYGWIGYDTDFNQLG